jgi:hypothetical protein
VENLSDHANEDVTLEGTGKSGKRSVAKICEDFGSEEQRNVSMKTTYF